MQLLPQLTAGGFAWQLPLADSVAARMVLALAIDDDRQRVRQLTAILRDDPSLVLWTICATERSHLELPRSVTEIAERLAAQAIEMLLSTTTTATGCEDTPEKLPEFAVLTFASVAVAHQAAELCGDESQREMAFLLGLLHNSGGWLQRSAADDHSGDAELTESCCPAWLVRWLDNLAREPLNQNDTAVVRAAIERFEHRDAQPVNEPNSLSSHIAYAAAVCNRWSTSLPSADDSFARLIGKLVRLQELESEFGATLEREKLAAMKQLAYGASHEINNPLANISTRAQTLLRDETDPERRRKLATINAQAFRAYEMISDMMLFAHPPQIHPEPVDLVAIVDEVIEELADGARQQATLLARDEAAPLIAVADPTQLAVAVKALCQNSLEAIGAGGAVNVSVIRPDAPSVDELAWCGIEVRDNGPGISPEVRRHLFDPFYSGREAGRGLGFGLSKCWRIVTQHGGKVDVASTPGAGATISILIPYEPRIANELEQVAYT